MPEVPLYTMDGRQTGTLALPDSVFGVEPNTALVHQAVVAEEANARQGTADTKTRGEVRGGGRKPWRQKGTGRARQGSIRAPHWYHGGVVFGPHPRSYRQALPKKMRRGALRSALSAKISDGTLFAIDTFEVAGETPKTRIIAESLAKLPLTKEVSAKFYDSTGLVRTTKQVPHKVLVIVPEYDETLLKSCRNIPHLTLRHAPSFSVRDIMVAGRVILAQGAVEKITEVLG